MNVGPRRRTLAGRFGVYVGALLVLCFFGAPLVWMVSTAFKPQSEWFSIPPQFVPERSTLENFRSLGDGRFPRYFLNSAVVASLTTAPTIVVAIGAAYAVAFLRFAGTTLLVPAVLLTQLIPTAVMVIPLYRTAARLGALDSLIGLAIAYMSFSAPVAVWLLRGFFVNLPGEPVEAAQLDGCTPFGAFRRVMLPLAVPGIAATAVYVFFSAWQEFILALTFISTKERATLPVGIRDFVGERTTDWGALMAGSVVLIIPLFIIFSYLQRFLVAGLSHGATKG